MVYGTSNNVMALAYGGAKSTTPTIVTAALQQATSLINACLNVTSDLVPVPQTITDASELIASEIVKNPRTPIKDLLEFTKTLVSGMIEQVNEDEVSNWANMRFV